MQIVRKYEHADYGSIGEVTLVVPESGWTLNGKALSESSIRHLATFSLQSLQDAYAGAKTPADAEGNWGKKLDRILAGTIGTREGGSRDAVKARAIIIALRHVKVDTKGMEAKDAGKARRAAALKAIERNPAYRSLAQAQIDQEKALGEYDADADFGDETETDEAA